MERHRLEASDQSRIVHCAQSVSSLTRLRMVLAFPAQLDCLSWIALADCVQLGSQAWVLDQHHAQRVQLVRHLMLPRTGFASFVELTSFPTSPPPTELAALALLEAFRIPRVTVVSSAHVDSTNRLLDNAQLVQLATVPLPALPPSTSARIVKLGFTLTHPLPLHAPRVPAIATVTLISALPALLESLSLQEQHPPHPNADAHLDLLPPRT
jgi:hypothetical protein